MCKSEGRKDILGDHRMDDVLANVHTELYCKPGRIQRIALDTDKLSRSNALRQATTSGLFITEAYFGLAYFGHYIFVRQAAVVQSKKRNAYRCILLTAGINKVGGGDALHNDFCGAVVHCNTIIYSQAHAVCLAAIMRNNPSTCYTLQAATSSSNISLYTQSLHPYADNTGKGHGALRRGGYIPNQTCQGVPHTVLTMLFLRQSTPGLPYKAGSTGVTEKDREQKVSITPQLE